MPPDDMRPVVSRGTPAGTVRLLRRYEALARASRSMLDAARKDDWNQVALLEARCVALIDELKAALKLQALSEDEQRQRIALLRAILADDAEMCVRAEPWLAQLDQMVRSAPNVGSASVTRALTSRVMRRRRK